MFSISLMLAHSEFEKRKNWIGGFVLVRGREEQKKKNMNRVLSLSYGFSSRWPPSF